MKEKDFYRKWCHICSPPVYWKRKISTENDVISALHLSIERRRFLQKMTSYICSPPAYWKRRFLQKMTSYLISYCLMKEEDFYIIWRHICCPCSLMHGWLSPGVCFS
jgi:hypothetical protein